MHTLRLHGYSIEWVENLMPFERDIYIDKLVNHINTLKQEQENQ